MPETRENGTTMTVSAHRDSTSPNTSEDSYVIGVDFGTLSGRALVVRVSDGAELGTGGLPVPARRDGREAGRDRRAAAAGLGAAGPGGLPGRAARRRCRPAVRRPGIDPAQVIGIGTDFTACTVLPVLRDGTPLCQLPELGGRPHAYAQAVEAPRRAAAGRPDQRPGPRARRAVDRPVRRQDLLRVAVRQGAAAAGGGPGRSTSGPSAGSRRPTGSSGSCAAPRPATPAPPGTRASTRTATTRRRTYLAALNPELRRLRARTSWPIRSRALGTRAGSLTAEAAALDRAAGGHRGRGRATWTRTSPRPPRTPSHPARWSPSWAPRPAT